MAREKLSYEDEGVFASELEHQTDRGVAIIAAAYLDAKLGEMLEILLGEHLNRSETTALFEGPNAPLGSFSSRIRMAYALGLAGPKTRSDLDLIRGIRNDFAHRLKIQSFDDPVVAGKCQSLKLADVSILGGTPPKKPRARFIQSTILALHYMYGEMRGGFSVVNKPRVSP